MEELSSSISSRSLLTSSCNCCLSCWSFPMCSTVFCKVTALLIWTHRGGIGKREGEAKTWSIPTAAPPPPWFTQENAHTHIRLGLQGGNQAAECFKANVDVGPSLLLGRYVCWSAALSRSDSGTVTKGNREYVLLNTVCSETAQTCLQGSEPTCFCSFFTKGVELLLISDPGLGTWSNPHGEPSSDPGWPWAAEHKGSFFEATLRLDFQLLSAHQASTHRHLTNVLDFCGFP